MHASFRWTVALALTALLGGAGLAGAQPKPCDLDAVPAATLLVPYFSATGVPGPTVTTLLAVINTTSSTRIAHFTLWTDWAIPTASFDVVLTPSDVLTMDINNIFVEGPPLQEETPLCREANGLLPGTLHLNAALGTAATLEEKLALLAKAHRGEVLPNNTVAGSPQDFLVGYVTIDVVNRCTTLFPSSPNYFKKGGTGIASDINALVGDMIWADLERSITVADVMVHIRAHKTAFVSGKYTFYGRYVNKKATDDRQPLGRTFGNRYLQGFAAGTLPIETVLVVWRDTKSPNPAPVPAGSQPSWVPLPVRSFTYWDEEENPGGGSLGDGLGLATQALELKDVGLEFPFGWMRMDLGHRKTSLFGVDAQAWVVPVFQASDAPGVGVFTGVGLRSFLLQGLCKP